MGEGSKFGKVPRPDGLPPKQVDVKGERDLYRAVLREKEGKEKKASSPGNKKGEILWLGQDSERAKEILKQALESHLLDLLVELEGGSLHELQQDARAYLQATLNEPETTVRVGVLVGGRVLSVHIMNSPRYGEMKFKVELPDTER